MADYPHNNTKKLILASSSVYRQAQLQQLGLVFDTIPADVDESTNPGETAALACRRLAIAKAHAIGKRASKALIIGADQTASLGKTILGKPGTHQNAIDQLCACNGREVTFYSGLCLFDTESNTHLVESIITRVKFRVLNPQQIINYVNRDQPYDCAGSFKSEGLGIALFESIQSDDPTALVGLPLIALNKLLFAFGVDCLVKN